MAAESRVEDAAVEQPLLEAALSDEPTGFSFFQAVRLLERLAPDRVAVGHFGDPAQEAVRFSVPPSIAFPPSEIQALDVRSHGPAAMSVNFMGLTGPQGVLPLYYTLFVAERVRERDPAIKAFLDIFHHRMTSLFYRAWEKQRFAIAYERDRRDRVTEHLLDLVGLGAAAHQDKFPFRDESLLFYAGLLAPQPRSAAALRQMLEDYFRVPVVIEEFVGAWYPLSTGSQCAIDDDGGGRLGMGAVAGDEIWDQQGRVRIKLGPMPRTAYDAFLPGGSAYEPLRALTRFFSDDQFGFEVQLVLAGEDVPACILGSEATPVPLGHCSWIRTMPFSHDADQTILTLSE